VSFPLAFPPITYTRSSSLPFVLLDPPISSFSLDYYYSIWRRVLIMKLLAMQFSPLTRHLITHIQNHRQNYSLVYSNFYVFYSR
jgi:hypothetical protein